MKKLVPLVIIFILVLVTISGCDTRDTSPREVEVYGRITDYWDGSAIQNAEVEIEGEVEYTDDEGNFKFESLFPQKTVEVKVNADNYWTETTRTSLTGSEEFIEISLKQEDIFSGSVAGKVYLQDTSTSLGLRAESTERKAQDLEKIDSDVRLKSVDRGREDIPAYAENEVLVKFRDSSNIISLQQEDRLLGEISSLAADESHLPRNIRSKLKVVRDQDRSASELIEYYESLPEVESASYNRIGVHTGRAVAAEETDYYSYDYRVPNDDRFDEQWYHWDIYSPEAWTLTTGSSDVTVAVLDTGYISHEDLNANIDEDEAYYYIDDDSGPGAEDEDAIYDERTSHGTHISGLIGAVGNNNEGIAGVNWDVNLMPIRIFSDGYFRENDLINAIYHAANNDADVINLSLAFLSDSREGDDDYSELSEALEYARDEKGVTIVAAAGNDGKYFSYYPANSNYTISVAASGYHPDNYYAPYSNRGEDVMAPGGNIDYVDGGIISTHGYYDNQYDDRYIFMAGTSQATALVSGAAALLNDQGIEDPTHIQQALEDSSDSTTGNINIYEALGEELPEESLYDEMEVLAAIKSEGTYYIVSDIDQPNRHGEYYLDRVVTEEEIKIIAWVDMDDSGSITAGDYFGESNTIEIPRWSHKGRINFDVKKVEETGLISSQSDSLDIMHSSPEK